MVEQYYSRILPLSDIKNPKIQLAYDYWLEVRNGREMPARADLRPEDMKDVLGEVAMIDVSYDPRDFRYSLFGTTIAGVYGYDMTGKSVRQLKPEGAVEIIWSILEEVLETRTPGFHAIGFEIDCRRIEYERLTLPLSSGGRRIDKLLSVAQSLAEFRKEYEKEVDLPQPIS